MGDRRIVSPFFLDRSVPQLTKLAGTNDAIIATSPGEGDEIERIAPIHRDLAAEVEQAAKAGLRPVVIMGDCCQTIPILAGLQRAGIDPTLIWLDAHGDFNTRETTPSNFLGGMPLAMITGRGDLGLNRNVGLHELPDERVILCDARDLDPGEKRLLEDSNVRHVGDLDELLAKPLPGGPVYVHFDTDIISSDDAPAFHYPVRGGPSADRVTEALARIARQTEIVAASMTAWAPDLDKTGKTERTCLAAFAALSGWS
jgi:arginase